MHIRNIYEGLHRANAFKLILNDTRKYVLVNNDDTSRKSMINSLDSCMKTLNAIPTGLKCETLWSHLIEHEDPLYIDQNS
jgi:hypothetical protein